MNFRKHVITTAVAVTAVLGGGGAALASTSTAAHHPQVSARAATTTGSGLTPLVQEFTSGIGTFCPSGSGNLPCNGAAPGGVAGYGTITSTPYVKDGIPALAAGESHYAETAGTGTTAAGCPATTAQENADGDEYCTGPYALFDGGNLATFPANGFTVTADVYLTPSEPGDISVDTGLNNNGGTYGNDEIISFCPVASGGLAVSTGGVDSCDGDTTASITKAGWYRLVWAFGLSGSNIVLNENVTSEATGFAVWQGQDAAPVTIDGAPATTSNTGGPGYFWIPVENTNSVPLSNFAVQLGVHPGGSKPDTVTVSPLHRTVSETGRVKLPVSATSVAGHVKFTVSGAPGLRFARGYVLGHVAKGRYIVTVSATDAAGVTGHTSFRLIARR